MKAYKIKILSNDGAIIGVKMMTQEQYTFAKELFNDLNENNSPNVSLCIEGSDILFNIEECSEKEFKMTEQGIKYVGETLGC